MTAQEPQLTIPRLDGSPRILVVDDNNMNCLVAWNYCEAFGCKVETACDGRQAVEFCEVKEYDIVLMDVRMPQMNGIQATEMIRALPGMMATVPIIAVTGDGDLSDRDMKLIGFNSVLVKPISMSTLYAAVRSALPNLGSERPAVEAA